MRIINSMCCVGMVLDVKGNYKCNCRAPSYDIVEVGTFLPNRKIKVWAGDLIDLTEEMSAEFLDIFNPPLGWKYLKNVSKHNRSTQYHIVADDTSPTVRSYCKTRFRDKKIQLRFPRKLTQFKYSYKLCLRCQIEYWRRLE